MKTGLVLLFLALLTVNVSTHSSVPPAQTFDYDANAALGILENSKKVIEGITVYDLSYAGPKGGRVTSYLIVPPGKGPFAALLYVHWGQGDRTEFLSEALVMAKRGVVSLLIDGPFARADADRDASFTHPEKERDQWIKGVIEMRRGIDVLRARNDVDLKRIGYVGHSYGATFGGVLAGIEKRIKAYVLIGGLPGFTFFDDPVLAPFMKGFTAEQKQKYADAIQPIEPIRFVGNSSPASLFFQFAQYDRYISEPAANRFFDAAGQPKNIKWYFCSHEFNDPESRTDRLEWISRQLEVHVKKVRR
jgi:dienelactone hydrolase